MYTILFFKRQAQIFRENGAAAWLQFDAIKLEPGSSTILSKNLRLPQ